MTAAFLEKSDFGTKNASSEASSKLPAEKNFFSTEKCVNQGVNGEVQSKDFDQIYSIHTLLPK